MSNTNKRRVRRAQRSRRAQGTRRAQGKRRAYRYSYGGTAGNVKLKVKLYNIKRELENETKKKTRLYNKKPLRSDQLNVLKYLGIGSSEKRKFQRKEDKYNEALAKKTAKTLYARGPTSYISPGFVSHDGDVPTQPFVTHAQASDLLKSSPRKPNNFQSSYDV